MPRGTLRCRPSRIRPSSLSQHPSRHPGRSGTVARWILWGSQWWQLPTTWGFWNWHVWMFQDKIIINGPNIWGCPSMVFSCLFKTDGIPMKKHVFWMANGQIHNFNVSNNPEREAVLQNQAEIPSSNPFIQIWFIPSPISTSNASIAVNTGRLEEEAVHIDPIFLHKWSRRDINWEV